MLWNERWGTLLGRVDPSSEFVSIHNCFCTTVTRFWSSWREGWQVLASFQINQILPNNSRLCSSFSSMFAIKPNSMWRKWAKSMLLFCVQLEMIKIALDTHQIKLFSTLVVGKLKLTCSSNLENVVLLSHLKSHQLTQFSENDFSSVRNFILTCQSKFG